MLLSIRKFVYCFRLDTHMLKVAGSNRIIYFITFPNRPLLNSTPAFIQFITYSNWFRTFLTPAELSSDYVYV